MNVQEEFDRFYSLLKKHTGNTYVNEMLHEVEESEILFHPPSRLETRHLFRIYSDRFIIQKDVTKHDLVEGWEDALNNLGKENDVVACITSLTTSTASYIVFTSIAIDRIIGILKSRNNDLKKAVELAKVYSERKLTTPKSKLFKKKILQNG